jgi:hypothetical protein
MEALLQVQGLFLNKIFKEIIKRKALERHFVYHFYGTNGLSSLVAR